MSLKCRFHKDEVIERVCASARWKQDPALCWQCMVDQASRVKDHKEHIVKVDEFVTRIAKEFESLVEARHAEKPKAKGEYIQLYDEGENYVDKFKETIDKRKVWLVALINQIIASFTEECNKVVEALYSQYDNKAKYFEELYKSLHDAVELRYGLSKLPSVEDINKRLNEIAAEGGDCNPYIVELKDKLLPPLDLDRNIQFQETLTEFYQIYELSEQLNKDAEKQEDVPPAEEEPEEGEKPVTKPPLDPLGMEILRQFEQQSVILFEELIVGVQYRDLMLGRNHNAQSRMRDLNESLNTIFSPERLTMSRQRPTVAQRLYDDSPFKETSPYPKTIQNGREDSRILTRQSTRIASFDQTVHTDQSKALTSIVWINPNLIITGSRDKSIQVTNIDGRDFYSLQGHTDQVTALCPFQSKILVSGGGNLDSTLIVWSLSQRKSLHVMKGHQSGITAIVDLQDGHTVASGSYDNHAIIWDVHEGAPVCALRKHTAMISCLHLTQKRDHLLTGSWDRSIAVWEFSFEAKARNVKGAKYLREIKCDSAVLCLQTIGDRQVAYGGTGNRVTVMDWIGGEIKRKLNTSQFGIQELRLFGNMLVGLGATDGTLRVWNLQSGENQEKEVLRDPEHIFINNFNTSPKMTDLGDGRLAIVNSTEKPAIFNIYAINAD